MNLNTLTLRFPEEMTPRGPVHGPHPRGRAHYFPGSESHNSAEVVPKAGPRSHNSGEVVANDGPEATTSPK
jgi:hypothetical protein